MKRQLPLLLTSVVGLVMLLHYFVPLPLISVPGHFFEESIIIVAFAIVLGSANVLKVNGEAVMRRTTDWPYKAVLLISMFIMIAIGFSDGPQRYLEPESGFIWMYDTFYVSMQATMFALLAFFIASAAFRAFRIRNLEAALLAIAAVIVMLGRVPIGNLISSWMWEPLQFPAVADWLMNVPQNAAKRGILIGAALGVMSTGLRIILGVETSFMRGGESR